MTPLDQVSLLRALEETSPVGLAAVDPGRRQIYVNRAFCELTGYSEAELLGREAPFPYWPPEELPRIQRAFETAMAGRAPREGFSIRYAKKDGARIDVRLYIASIRDDAGAPQGIVATAIDESALMRSERQRRAEREEGEMLRAIFEQMPAAVLIADAQGVITYQNPASRRIFGAEVPTPDATQYDRAFRVWSAAGKLLASEDYPLLRALRGEQISGEIVEFERPGGGRAFVQVNAGPLRDAGGALTGAVTTYTDITGARRERRAQEEERERLHLTLQQAPVAVAIFRGAEHRFELANPRYEEMVGRGSLAGKTVLEAFPEIPRDAPVVQSLDRAFRGETVSITELNVPLRRGASAELRDAFFNYVLQPIRTAAGESLGSMVVAVEVTEQVQARRNVDALRAAAEGANRAKDEFLAILGHELRNPLAPILTALQLLRARGVVGGERERAVIERQVQHLIRLVDDLLDVARVARGDVELRKRAVRLREVAQSAIELASPLLEGRRHHFVSDIEEGLSVYGDPVRLSQVLANLLTNAAKYTPPGGNISLRAGRQGERIRLEVQDDGIGIAPQLLPRVFEMFVQGERGLDRSQGGLGLGLAIVQSLVALHGGTVEARSGGENQGSTFVITLDDLLYDAPEETPRAFARRASVAPRRVLVVDDNDDAALTLAEGLRGHGHVVRTAHDGPSALQAAQSFKPDIALVDLGLPVMDGFELARRLHATAGLEKLKLVAVTGYGQSMDRERSRAAGFAGHLVKPVDLEQVAAQVNEP